MSGPVDGFQYHKDTDDGFRHGTRSSSSRIRSRTHITSVLDDARELEKKHLGALDEVVRLWEDTQLVDRDIPLVYYTSDRDGIFRLESQICNAYSEAVEQVEDDFAYRRAVQFHSLVRPLSRQLVYELVVEVENALRDRELDLSRLREDHAFQQHVVVAVRDFTQRLASQAWTSLERELAHQLSTFWMTVVSKVLLMPIWDVIDIACGIDSVAGTSQAESRCSADTHCDNAETEQQSLDEGSVHLAGAFVFESEAYYDLEDQLYAFGNFHQECAKGVKPLTAKLSANPSQGRRGSPIAMWTLRTMSRVFLREKTPPPGTTRVRWTCVHVSLGAKWSQHLPIHSVAEP